MGSTVLYWTSSHADHELDLELLHLTNLFEHCSGRHAGADPEIQTGGDPAGGVRGLSSGNFFKIWRLNSKS